MCEFTLIQSHDDLEAAECLLNNKHYCQSVFMSSQSVDKCLKSLLYFFRYSFSLYSHQHCASKQASMLKYKHLKHPGTPYEKYNEQFQTLCDRFESLGAESWMYRQPLSIRSRYFNYQTESLKNSESQNHYFVNSYPGVVFTCDVATEAFEIAKALFEMSEHIHEENVQNFDILELCESFAKLSI